MQFLKKKNTNENENQYKKLKSVLLNIKDSRYQSHQFQV